MPIAATLVTGKTDYGAEPEILVDAPTDSTGQRDYAIESTDDIDAAWGATGLPAKGTAWSGVFPNLTAQRRIMKPVVRHPDGSGLFWCRVEYAAPGLAFRTQAGFDGLKYSEIRLGTESRPQYTDVAFNGSNASTVVSLTDPLDGLSRERRYGEQINRGRGTERDWGVLEIDITHWRTPGSITATILNNLAKLSLERPRNSDTSLALPAFVGTNGVSWTLGAGQVRYLGFRLGGDGVLSRIVHTVQVRSDFYYRWNTTDAFGAAIGPLRINHIIPERSLAGIW